MTTEHADFYQETLRTARTSHKCGCCYAAIGKFEQYYDARTLFDGSWTSDKQCLRCRDLTVDVTDGEFVFVPNLDEWVYERDDRFEHAGCQRFIYDLCMDRVKRVQRDVLIGDIAHHIPGIPPSDELWRIARILEEVSEQLLMLHKVRRADAK